jgi:hypothetical protein
MSDTKRDQPVNPLEVEKGMTVVNTVTRDRCYDLFNIFAEKIGEKNGVFDSKQS